MGQWGGLGQRGVELRRRRGHGRAQRAVHRFSRCGAVIVALHHQLHHACAGTHHVHALGVEHGRCNGHTHRQCKPHQHEAGELDGMAKLLHLWNYDAYEKPIEASG